MTKALAMTLLLMAASPSFSCSIQGKTGHVRLGEVRNHGDLRLLAKEINEKGGYVTVHVKAPNYDESFNLTRGKVITKTICSQTISFGLAAFAHDDWAAINVGAF